MGACYRKGRRYRPQTVSGSLPLSNTVALARNADQTQLFRELRAQHEIGIYKPS